MSSKRKNAPSFSQGQTQSKRYRPSPPDYDDGSDEGESSKNSKYTTASKLDPDTGQRGAFPGLGPDNGEDPLFYGPASDGLEYLRMVRSEAKTVPRLLVATREEAEQEEEDDDNDPYQDHTEGGWYSDGAYTGAAQLDPYLNPLNDDASDESELDAQEAYYAALLARFEAFRTALNQPPPPLSSSQPPSPSPPLPDGVNANVARAQAEYAFKKTQPTARGLAQASQEDVIRGLGRLRVALTKSTLTHAVTGRNLSAWLWALLAKCRATGLMNSDHISVLRELAKEALVVRGKIRIDMKAGESGVRTVELGEDNVGRQDVGVGEITDVEEGEVADEGERNGSSDQVPMDGSLQPVDNMPEPDTGERDLLEEKKRALLQKTLHMPGDGKETNAIEEKGSELQLQALATIDIVVTIVGDVFGQRDLLDRREAWE